ncbi:anti-sigma factor [Alphaproteobacteria bacterium KMM 3653]|uniref:Anti-sigma factor n=1 Tax=Harenicola maris TaxID=2841044 RepID=A0AAP2G930_9RHOB|nr:anti-sigma factor [Harenicola maris]
MTNPVTEQDALQTRISAYIDGALPPQEAEAFEAEAAANPEVAAELDAMLAVEAELTAAFDDLLDTPVPEALEQGIMAEQTPAPSPAPAAANANQPPQRNWPALATAACALLAVGVAGGYGLGLSNRAAPEVHREYVEVVKAPGWKAQVADYHRIYAAQTRHLVEVPATEKDHIETWLTATIGAPVRVPDLSGAGYTFEGARLLVAAGKPVFQLVFTDANGGVIALCGLKGGGNDAPAPQEFGDLTMIGWQNAETDFVLVGPAETDLIPLAETLATSL